MWPGNTMSSAINGRDLRYHDAAADAVADPNYECSRYAVARSQPNCCSLAGGGRDIVGPRGTLEGDWCSRCRYPVVDSEHYSGTPATRLNRAGKHCHENALDQRADQPGGEVVHCSF